MLLLLVYDKKIIIIIKEVFCTYQGFKKTFLLSYMHIYQSFYCTYLPKFLLYIIFITKDRKGHSVWNTLYSVFLLFIYSFIFCSVIAIHIDYLSYARGYDIRQYNEISHCDYFRLQE